MTGTTTHQELIPVAEGCEACAKRHKPREVNIPTPEVTAGMVHCDSLITGTRAARSRKTFYFTATPLEYAGAPAWTDICRAGNLHTVNGDADGNPVVHDLQAHRR